MRKSAVYIDCFTTLDEIPKNLHSDHDVVCEALKKVRRFSVWDATSTDAMAHTMTELCKPGGRVVTDTETVGFPWTLVVSVDGEPVKP